MMLQVAGGTASGKSTVCEKIMESLRQIDLENVERQVNDFDDYDYDYDYDDDDDDYDDYYYDDYDYDDYDDDYDD